MAAPDVDDQFTVNIDGYRRADFLTAGDGIRQRLAQALESGVTAAMHDVVHRHIMRCRSPERTR